MGTPIPRLPPTEPVPPGNPCNNCWGEGGYFEIPETPSEIEISFSGIQKGEQWESWMVEPFNNVYTLEQSGWSNCTFVTYNQNWEISVEFRADETAVFIVRVNPYVVMFRSYSISRCILFLLNEEDRAFKSGTALITVPVVE